MFTCCQENSPFIKAGVVGSPDDFASCALPAPVAHREVEDEWLGLHTATPEALAAARRTLAEDGVSAAKEVEDTGDRIAEAVRRRNAHGDCAVEAGADEREKLSLVLR
jgi:hypothetical protein